MFLAILFVVGAYFNVTFHSVPSSVAPLTTFTDCNCQQSTPHTPFVDGVSGLRFVRCNLINCDLPEDAILVDCLHFHQRKVVEFTKTAEEFKENQLRQFNGEELLFDSSGLFCVKSEGSYVFYRLETVE